MCNWTLSLSWNATATNNLLLSRPRIKPNAFTALMGSAAQTVATCSEESHKKSNPTSWKTDWQLILKCTWINGCCGCPESSLWRLCSTVFSTKFIMFCNKIREEKNTQLHGGQPCYLSAILKATYDPNSSTLCPASASCFCLMWRMWIKAKPTISSQTKCTGWQRGGNDISFCSSDARHVEYLI